MKILTFLLLLGVITNVYSYGVDIYMAELQVSKGAEVSSRKIIENSSFTSLLTYELSKMSSGDLAYKGLKKLSLPSRRVLKSEYITSKIDALVVCHFEKIDYIVFGTLLIDPDTNKYSTSLKLYSLEKNAIIHEMNLDKIVTNESDYIKELSNVINSDLQRLSSAEVIKEAEITTAAVVAESKETDKTEAAAETETEAEAAAETTAAAVVTPTGEKDKEEIKEQIKEAENVNRDKPLNAILAKFIKKKEEEKQEVAAAEAQKPAEKLVSVFTSLGYFVPFSGEWTPYLLACVSLEQGVKYHFYLANTEGFDFLIRPAFFVNYSFALNPDLSFLIHYHTLKLKGTLDAYFEFGDFFAFYVGGGPFYRFDIIDFETPHGIFRTDLPYALGTTILLGVEFHLNKEKTFSLGVVNALDMTFYAEMIIEYEIMAQVIFKL
ncbi:MAG: hypothetical protein JW822_13665 [Spirochaetales bacterium]|nr:hypothetical protein [Spirochaetales bacterium]